MVDCHKIALPFVTNKGLLEDKLTDLVEFALPCKWKKQLLVQRYEATDNDLCEFIKFCEILHTYKEIYDDYVEITHHN